MRKLSLWLVLVFVGSAAAAPKIRWVDDELEPVIEYVDDTNGRRLLRDLLALAHSPEDLILPLSDKEDELADEIDLILSAGFDQMLYLPAATVVSEMAEDILWEFLRITGLRALDYGVRREDFLTLIRRQISPRAASCEVHLNAHRLNSKTYN